MALIYNDNISPKRLLISVVSNDIYGRLVTGAISVIMLTIIRCSVLSVQFL